MNTGRVRQQADANGGLDNIKNHAAPWGMHRQGGFIDPFGHTWLGRQAAITMLSVTKILR